MDWRGAKWVENRGMEETTVEDIPKGWIGVERNGLKIVEWNILEDVTK